MSNALLVSIFGALLILAVACGDDDEAGVTPVPTPAPTASEPSIEFGTVLSGASSGITTDAPVLRIAATRSAWDALWAEHQAIVTPATDPPAVDFASQIVIAVFDQQHPTGGYSVEVQRITTDDGDVTVAAERRSPGRDCTVTQALTQPFHIVAVDRLDGPFTLSLTETVVDCE